MTSLNVFAFLRETERHNSSGQKSIQIGALGNGKRLTDFWWNHVERRVTIWCKQHESMNPSCLMSTVEAGGGRAMVWGMFSWHNLGHLIHVDGQLDSRTQ